MNVLIMTGRFGMGHVKCAEAIKEHIEHDNADTKVSIVDFCDYCFPKVSSFIYKIFEICVFRFSDAYNKLSKVAGRLECMPFRRTISKRMERLISEFEPDLVIADLPMCVQYYSTYKRKHSVDIPFYVYITDITIHNDWISTDVDKYFVGDEVCKDTLIKEGISRDSVYVTGIPVSDKFKEADSKSSDLANVLIMGGGLGLIPCKDEILSALNSEAAINTTVICGKNASLYQEICEKYKNITAVGFTKKVPEYLKGSDLIITKPGGITTFEAIKAETPLYIIEPTLEQELGNADFIERKKLGKVVAKKSEFDVSSLLSYIKNKTDICEAKENMRKLSNSFADSNPVHYMEVA